LSLYSTHYRAEREVCVYREHHGFGFFGENKPSLSRELTAAREKHKSKTQKVGIRKHFKSMLMRER